MVSTKTLYGLTLALAGLAGFSTGWTARPAEVRYLSLEERLLVDYERNWRLGPAEVARLRAILGEFTREMDALRKEFDNRFGDQVTLVHEKYDAMISAILTPDKRR